MNTLISSIDLIDQRADAVHDLYARRADSILSDRDMTLEAQRRQLEEATHESRAQLADLLSQRNSTRDAMKEKNMRSLFGYIVAPTGTDLLSRRDADERAARLDDQTSALEALERAELSGDSTLARSITLAALGRGWSAVIETYRASHPSAADALDQLAAIDRDESSLFGMRYSLMARRVV
jgi:vacuolar-type H+-ATPase subunit I/STV1